TTAVVVSILVMASASLAGEQSAAPVGSPIPHLPAPSLIIPGKLIRGSTGVEVDQLAERRTLRVCPPEGPKAPSCQFTQVSEALAQARPGDEVVLAPGVYRQGAVVAVDGITLRGEPGAHLQDQPVEGKAALVIRGAKVVVDGIECSGISVPDQNGACIRIE